MHHTAWNVGTTREGVWLEVDVQGVDIVVHMPLDMLDYIRPFVEQYYATCPKEVSKA